MIDLRVPGLSQDVASMISLNSVANPQSRALTILSPIQSPSPAVGVELVGGEPLVGGGVGGETLGPSRRRPGGGTAGRGRALTSAPFTGVLGGDAAPVQAVGRAVRASRVGLGDGCSAGACAAGGPTSSSVTPVETPRGRSGWPGSCRRPGTPSSWMCGTGLPARTSWSGWPRRWSPQWNVPDFIDIGLGCQVGEFSES
jgi:hypothetical protein